jgi:hypothetical protein
MTGCGLPVTGNPRGRRSARRSVSSWGVRQDLAYLEEILREHPEALSVKDLDYLAVIQAMYEQQKHMYETKTRKVEDRIVSLHQPWVWPIVRGEDRDAGGVWGEGVYEPDGWLCPD